MTAPFIKSNDSVRLIMLDVIIALLPLALIAWWAFGARSLTVMAATVAACSISDIVFSVIFLNSKRAVPDGSAIITGLLLAFTISPLTPWYVAAFGGASAILFGKILWGGTGKNLLNPALAGREFMVAFFPAIMEGSSIWNTSAYAVNHSVDFVFLHHQPLADSLNKLIFEPSGALGEYSLAALIAGGIYLIWRRRISWHIPVMFILTFFCIAVLINPNPAVKFSTGGLLLGGIYMATDMPTSPAHTNGKLYYGFMLGCVVALLLYCGISFAYMSFGILILNGFNPAISKALRPAPWGYNTSLRSGVESISRLTALILAAAMAAVGLHLTGLTHFPVYLFAIWMIAKYYYQTQHKILQPF